MSVLLEASDCPAMAARVRTGAWATEGRMSVRYADHEEAVSAGDVFYMAPGHVPTYHPGTG